jgi:hypothetical protein
MWLLHRAIRYYYDLRMRSISGDGLARRKM